MVGGGTTLLKPLLNGERSYQSAVRSPSNLQFEYPGVLNRRIDVRDLLIEVLHD